MDAEKIERVRGALRVGRDCVMESFDHVKTADDQMMADARLRDIDDALAILDTTADAAVERMDREHEERMQS